MTAAQARRAWRLGIACVAVVVLVVIAWGFALRLLGVT